jgi:hypothetical protein
MTLKGRPISNAQLKHERIMTVSENAQYARLIVLVSSTPKLVKRSVSDGAASMTCIDDSVNETLANKKSKGAAAASMYGIVDQ